jgi:CubicO group peptidase (beta-lactamase class C family)
LNYFEKKPTAIQKKIHLLDNFPNLNIHDILTHQSGFRAWMPIYEGFQKKFFFKTFEAWNRLAEVIAQELPERKNKKAVYSDLGFITLGLYMIEKEQKDLLSIWSRLNENLMLEHTHFNPNQKIKFSTKMYAPTASVKWGPKIRRGLVHDNNTLSMGGVSTHAGLFSNSEDVLTWCLNLRSFYREEKNSLCQNSNLRKLTFQRQMPRSYGDWSMGLMKPSLGKASCSPCFDRSSVGHLGYSGTSFWFDLKKDLIVILLANRNYPEKNKKQGWNQLRPKIHQWVCQSLDSR